MSEGLRNMLSGIGLVNREDHEQRDRDKQNPTKRFLMGNGLTMTLMIWDIKPTTPMLASIIMVQSLQHD